MNAHQIFRIATLLAGMAAAVSARATGTVEFCLIGEFNLGARHQGLEPRPGEFSPARWCVITQGLSGPVQFRTSGKSNPDMTGNFTVNYLPPDSVRIVNRDSPPDIRFRGVDMANEAARHRRIDPRRLVTEIQAHPEWVAGKGEPGWQLVDYPGAGERVSLSIVDGRLRELRTTADLPLRGRVPVVWRWDWRPDGTPDLVISVDGVPQFRAHGRWRTLDEAEASAAWALSGGEEPHDVPGNAWPSRVNMRLETLADGVYLVKGVRTGFQHLVVDTDKGLVVADAPAGWVEIPQIPPVDLVPGLGVSGLSEALIDFLGRELPGRPVRAVALTHAHDDHAGGSRAFAAAGAAVYAPASVAPFLEEALNRGEMPPDRLGEKDGRVTVMPVVDRLVLEDERNPVVLHGMGGSPHVSASLGVLAATSGYFFQSDLHVPNSEATRPRADRLETECWFAGWATRHLPPDAVVVNSHSGVHSPVSRLAAYHDGGHCPNR